MIYCTGLELHALQGLDAPLSYMWLQYILLMTIKVGLPALNKRSCNTYVYRLYNVHACMMHTHTLHAKERNAKNQWHFLDCRLHSNLPTVLT